MIEIDTPTQIPEFKTEDEEAEFWATHTLSERYLEQFVPLDDSSDEALDAPERPGPSLGRRSSVRGTKPATSRNP